MPTKTAMNRAEGSLIGKFVQRSKDSVQVEVPRADELTKTVQSEMRERLEGKGKRNRRQTKLAVMGIPTESLNGGDVRYARCVRLASAYRKVRSRELQVAHGYVSAGASALLSTAALALAASRFLYEKATEAGPDEVAGILKQASQLSDSARSNELAAWELCAREAVQRKKAEAAGAGVPWLIPQQDRRGAGRPRKDKLPDNTDVKGLLNATVIAEVFNGQRLTAQGNTEGQREVRAGKTEAEEASGNGNSHRPDTSGSGEDKAL